MLMLVGAGLHIAKEVGWLVSKGAMLMHDSAPQGSIYHCLLRLGAAGVLCVMQGLLALLPCRWVLPAAGTMFPPTKAEWKSPKFWMNWTTWWVSRIDTFPVSLSIKWLSLIIAETRCNFHVVPTSAHPVCVHCYMIGTYSPVVTHPCMCWLMHACPFEGIAGCAIRHASCTHA